MGPEAESPWDATDQRLALPHNKFHQPNNHTQDLHTPMHLENPCATTADNKSPPHSSKRKQQPRPGPTHIHAHGEPLCDNCRQQVAPTQQQEKATTTPRTYTHPCTWRTPVRQLPTTSRPHTAARESNNHAQDLHTSMHMENPCATTADNKSPPHSSKRKQQPRPGPTHIHAHGEPLCDNCRQQVAPTQQQ